MKKPASIETVNAFTLAVYPEMTELCMTMNGEEDILKEATRLLAERDKLLALLREARNDLVKIALYGNYSGVISCPQDFSFYIKPMQEIAGLALARIDAALEEKPNV